VRIAAPVVCEALVDVRALAIHELVSKDAFRSGVVRRRQRGLACIGLIGWRSNAGIDR
jgi:hypothetical protein